jgi:hypothetical protein
MSTPSPLSDFETRLKALEAKAAAEAKTLWTWVQANVVHLAGYVSIVAALKKCF